MHNLANLRFNPIHGWTRTENICKDNYRHRREIQKGIPITPFLFKLMRNRFTKNGSWSRRCAEGESSKLKMIIKNGWRTSRSCMRAIIISRFLLWAPCRMDIKAARQDGGSRSYGYARSMDAAEKLFCIGRDLKRERTNINWTAHTYKISKRPPAGRRNPGGFPNTLRACG